MAKKKQAAYEDTFKNLYVHLKEERTKDSF